MHFTVNAVGDANLWATVPVKNPIESAPAKSWVKRGKFYNKKTTVNGITFDSAKEAARYTALTQDPEVTNLRTQVEYQLLPSMKRSHGSTERGVKYIADFVYDRNGMEVVEDVMGCCRFRGHRPKLLELSQSLSD